MKLHIKNMVCDRCVMVVNAELEKMGYHTTNTVLGEVELAEQISDFSEMEALGNVLKNVGFELIDDRRNQITEKIKTVVIALIHHSEEQPRQKYSEIIAKELHQDYTYLSKLFSETEQITIEQYIIQQKIEKVKELLLYKELNLNEIAWKMGYSSTAHLSAQFKKITGCTPTQFKNDDLAGRISIDKIG
jgi:AraC family transcriptional regulator